MNLVDTATWLLGRPLTEQDGVSALEYASAEQRLDHVLPAPLREFYMTMGRQPVITESFQRFAEPRELSIRNDKIVFLEENQGVCYWATDAQSKVYQTTDLNDPEWYEEPTDLAEFLRVTLYYQMAQGGYPFCGMISGDQFTSPEDVRSLIDEMGGQLVVDMSGLKVFVVSDQVLVWYLYEDSALPDPGIFLSALHEDKFRALCDQCSFDDLD
jgi:hypothetical protein